MAQGGEIPNMTLFGMANVIRYFFVIFILCLVAGMPGAVSRDKSEVADSLFFKVSDKTVDRILEMADSSLRQGAQGDALSLYLIVCARQPEALDSAAVTNRVRAYVGVGDIMMRRCDYAGALDNYIQALIASEASPFQPMGAVIHKNIGNVYCCLNDYETGIDYYKKGLRICEAHPDKDVEKKLLTNLSGMTTYTGDTIEAEQYLVMSRRMYPPKTDEEIFLDGLLEGLLLKSKKRYGPAVSKLREMVNFARESAIEPRYEGSACQELYSAYIDMENADSALMYMHRCREVAEHNGLEMMFPSVYDALSEYYAENGHPGRAREYRTRFFDIRDSIMDDREFNAVKNVLFQYKAAKTADEIQSLYKDKDEKESIIRRQRMILLSVVAGAFVLSAIVLLFYIQKRRITRSHRHLYEIDRANTRERGVMDERHRDDMCRLEERDAEIARLKALLSSSREAGKEELTCCESSVKYKTSNLREPHRNKLAEAITAVMENDCDEFCNPEFSLERLAKIVGSNSKYVSQTINEEFNRNFSTYINDYRVKLACDRLANPEYDSYKIKFVGESVGFKSQSTFTEVFRRHTGLSPAVYRKMAREERGGC